MNNVKYKSKIFYFKLSFCIFFITCIFSLSACSMNNKNEFKNIRKSAVAGQFYPSDASDLRFKINKYLGEASKNELNGEIKAIIAPHAGYDFSALVAAYGFKLLDGRKVNTVIIIGNSHSTYFDGIAVDESDAWETPLGIVEVNIELAEKLVNADNSIIFDKEAHKNEHSLEVELPFLQIVLEKGFKIVPILFGNSHNNDYKKLAKILVDNLGRDDIIIVSTDMSHYPSYEDANKIDKNTLDMIKLGDAFQLENYINEVESQDIKGEQTLLCGVDGVKTIIELYNLLKWNEIKILKYANSGDMEIGDKKSVVGYGSVSFSGQRNEVKNLSVNNALNIEQKEVLLKIAKQTVESYVKTGNFPSFNISDERLNFKEGAFVTLHKNGSLRGCIGQIIPSDKPLWKVIRDMAVAACSEDGRFSPISEDELNELNYEISVLSVPEKIKDWNDIELGKHGVIVSKGIYSGVFLPQVADETGWSKEEFLSQLCSQKAGLSSDCYKNIQEVELKIFIAQVFGEK